MMTKSFMVFGLILFVCAPGFAKVLSNSPASGFRCKYSVRDVAFVNVHGKPWQLQLIKPDDVDPLVFESWSESLRNRLDNSNVGFVWHRSDSDEANRLLNQASQSQSSAVKDVPMIFLTGLDETTIPVHIPDEAKAFDQRLDALIDSPIRQKILRQAVDSLCVIVLVESGRESDIEADAVVMAAAEQVEKQMWMLEKPADKGPVVVKVAATDWENEKWLIDSLGIRINDLPAVAIVYGQGRRLGEVLVGENIAANKIVGRASVCGRDCECDLNRNWLYGQQMIHRWNKDLERRAEDSLSFDPKSAFVIAEVAQIIQKNSTGIGTGDRVDLGGGLVIHDLDELAPPTESSNESQEAKPEPNTAPAVAGLPDVSSVPNATGSTVVPWTLLASLAVSLIAVSTWLCLSRKAAGP